MSLFALLSSFFSWIFGRSRSSRRPLPEDDLPAAKVAVIGAGIGGCFAAKFLRENGGKNLDIHVFAKKGSKVGGRTAVFQFEGHLYETGASVIHSDNHYLVDAAKKHGLDTKTQTDDVPVGIFNGKTMLRFRMNKFLQIFQMLWRYGLDLLRMNSLVGATLKKFRNIYDLQASGKAYAHVEDMLDGMGGDSMRRLMKVSADDYMRKELGWNEKLVDEVITGALRTNYGQDTSVNAFTTLVSLAGMQSGSLWSVVGGNYLIAEAVLKESGASLVMQDVVSVTKVVSQEDDGGRDPSSSSGVRYTVATGDGETVGGFDVVIVANPLNVSSIKYEGFSDVVYTAAAKTPYQRTVATFCKGTINQEFFGERADSANFPQVILTTDLQSPPFDFNSCGVETPSELKGEEARRYHLPLRDEPVRLWKVFSPQPLTEAQRRQMFPDSKTEETSTFDWLAYPHYEAPYQAPSFLLEDEGVFYVNAVEKAASAMEMSAIGAKNAALLARDYLLLRRPKSSED